MDDSRNRKSTIALLVAVFWALTSFVYIGSLGSSSQPSVLANKYDSLEATRPVKDLGLTEIFNEISSLTKNRGQDGNPSGGAAASYIDPTIARLAHRPIAPLAYTDANSHSGKLWLLYRSLLI